MKSFHGICKEDLQIIRDILIDYKNVCIFGSRAKGTYEKFSDLDICFKQDISDYEYEILKEKFENSDLPITVDIIQYNKVSDSFKKIIDKECVPLDKLLSGAN